MGPNGITSQKALFFIVPQLSEPESHKKWSVTKEVLWISIDLSAQMNVMS